MSVSRATIFLAGAALVGGAAIGKAAIDHLALPREQRAITVGKPKLGRDPVAWAVALVGTGYVLYTVPALWREWSGYVTTQLK